MKTIDVTKLVVEGVRSADHVRIPGFVAGESIRGDQGEILVDWEHRCIVHFTPPSGEERPDGLYTIVPFDNVMWITAKVPAVKAAVGGKL